jgi:Pentapeptide repeats (8 copies)
MHMLRFRGARFTAALLALATVALIAASGALAWSGGGSIASGTTGTNGWFTSNVTVSYTFTGQGGYAPSEYEYLNQMTCTSNEGATTVGDGTTNYTGLTAALTLTGEGFFDTSCSGFGVEQHQTSTSGCGFFGFYPCYGGGGFGFGGSLTGIQIDQTPPVDVTVNGKPDPNSYGWYNSPFTMTISGVDPVSLIQSCSWGTPYGASPVTGSSITVNTNTAFGSAWGGCANKAGLRTSISTSWKYDSTAPTVTVTGVSNGSVYPADSVPTAGCGTSDALSGVATNATLSLSGGPLGSVAATCSGAMDKAGNLGSAAVSYWVDTSLNGYPQKNGVYNFNNLNLSGAYLDYLNLSGATGKGAKFSGASFIDTDLSNANLSQANLTNANLEGANLSGANLSGATLQGATGLDTATLTGVTWKQTTCPDGTTSNQDGGTCLNNLTP